MKLSADAKVSAVSVHKSIPSTIVLCLMMNLEIHKNVLATMEIGESWLAR
ncbi:hypothetical protein X777_02345 [Ooceraea biroi]|uniref:Uncharacterized protein n=1 Tax=Ooceraea biroi TaxID=2015173 RepID=A0A026WL30_OOCBI|nr:hypothetical protein X777_02345 [Ooceraea biroi]